MHKKAVDTCFFMLDCIPECYKTLKMREKSVFKRPNMLKYCLDRYTTQEMCEKTNASCLLAIKCDPDLFVTPKMLEDLDNTLLFNDNLDLDKDDDNNNVIFFNYNSDNIVFSDIVIGLVKRKLILLILLMLLMTLILSTLLKLALGVTNINNKRHLKKRSTET